MHKIVTADNFSINVAGHVALIERKERERERERERPVNIFSLKN
jgi:hypothetical protein